MKLKNFAIFMLISASLILSACEPFSAISSLPTDVLLYTPAQSELFCADCDQATLSVALTQQKQSADSQAAATAIIERAQAQAILNSANATLSAAQAQQQNNANILAAQVAATAEFVRANAQATVNSANSTQSAAQTQSQYNLQVTQAVATQRAEAIITQQNKNDVASGTQTAIADVISTQTQVAVATSQWYTDQERQRQEPIAFLWMWGFPVFMALFAGSLVWGFWRWLKIEEANQRILESTIEKLQAPANEMIDRQKDDSYLEGDIVDSRYQLEEPDEQVHRWIDEVKSDLLDADKKDEHDDTTH